MQSRFRLDDTVLGKMTCGICFDYDISADQMFYVGQCHHQFCFECLKRHIEVKLLEGSLMNCPRHYSCYSKLDLGSCVNLLTPKLKNLWEQKIREDSIPVTERIYCPNPRCSFLMSKTELSEEVGVRRWCFKCGKHFCINCKVPWHNNMWCYDYKRLNPNPTADDGKLKDLANQKMWRQCGKCQHMIELSQGCVSVICRCGHNFCYQCGAEAGGCPHGHVTHVLPPPPPPPPPPSLPLWLSVFCVVSFWCLLVLCIYAAHP